MRTLLLLAAIAVSALTALSGSLAAADASERPSVMPWLCLERCNYTRQQVHEHVQDIIHNKHLVSRVSFERYNLGAGATLIVNSDLTHVAPMFRKANITTIAMISSYPYPKDFIEWMRAVFAKPMPFLETVLAHLKQDQIDGVNIDWEPAAGNITAADATQYAQFLGIASSFLGANGFIMTTDFATWSPIWNLRAISDNLIQTLNPLFPLPSAISMSTYTYNNTVFLNQLNVVLSEMNSSIVTIGLQTFNGKTDPVFRFNALTEKKLCRAAIWDAPIDNRWWNAIATFIKECKW